MNDFGFHDTGFRRLLGYLAQVPAVRTNGSPARGFGTTRSNRQWAVKLAIDIDHVLAWRWSMSSATCSTTCRSTTGCRRSSSPYRPLLT